MNDRGFITKELLRKKGLTGQKRAKRIGITTPSLRQIVHRHAKPRQGAVSKLCEVLGTDLLDEKQPSIDRAIRIAALLKKKLRCKQTFIVVPDARRQALLIKGPPSGVSLVVFQQSERA